MIAGWRSKTVAFVAVLLALLTFGALATASADPRDLAQSADIAAAQALHSRGLAAWREGKYSEAEGLYKRALAIREKALGANHPDLGQTLHNLGLVYAAQRKYSEAEGVYKRALAVTTTRRSEALPDIPTAAEFVPGYEASSWFGIGAPNNTPAEIVDKLNNEVNAVLADPNMKARLADLGGTALAGSPADFGADIGWIEIPAAQQSLPY